MQAEASVSGVSKDIRYFETELFLWVVQLKKLSTINDKINVIKHIRR
jgi:hypothetical protein